jgi:hypothetical protein
MRVTVQSVTPKNNLRYAIKLLIDGLEHSGTLAFDDSVKVWNPDRDFQKALESMSLAPRCVLEIVTRVHRGEPVSFPVDLGEFQSTVPPRSEQ